MSSNNSLNGDAENTTPTSPTKKIRASPEMIFNSPEKLLKLLQSNLLSHASNVSLRSFLHTLTASPNSSPSFTTSPRKPLTPLYPFGVSPVMVANIVHATSSSLAIPESVLDPLKIVVSKGGYVPSYLVGDIWRFLFSVCSTPKEFQAMVKSMYEVSMMRDPYKHLFTQAFSILNSSTRSTKFLKNNQNVKVDSMKRQTMLKNLGIQLCQMIQYSCNNEDHFSVLSTPDGFDVLVEIRSMQVAGDIKKLVYRTYTEGIAVDMKLLVGEDIEVSWLDEEEWDGLDEAW
ncbi:hypothetical protein HDV05_001829, partial [Chytridiales sp. JEL 0842]